MEAFTDLHVKMIGLVKDYWWNVRWANERRLLLSTRRHLTAKFDRMQIGCDIQGILFTK